MHFVSVKLKSRLRKHALMSEKELWFLYILLGQNCYIPQDPAAGFTFWWFLLLLWLLLLFIYLTIELNQIEHICLYVLQKWELECEVTL